MCEWRGQKVNIYISERKRVRLIGGCTLSLGHLVRLAVSFCRSSVVFGLTRATSVELERSQQAPVHVEDLAIYKISGRRGEKYGGAHEFMGLTPAARRASGRGQSADGNGGCPGRRGS